MSTIYFCIGPRTGPNQEYHLPTRLVLLWLEKKLEGRSKKPQREKKLGKIMFT